MAEATSFLPKMTPGEDHALSVVDERIP